MQRSNSLIFAALFASPALVQAQSPLLSTLRAPDKAVATVGQTLEGVWLGELRRPGVTASQPGVLGLVTYHPDGTVNSTTSDGPPKTTHGVWVRVGDRKFLHTVLAFGYDEKGVFVNLLKIRINSQLSADGLTLKGTNELVIMDLTGKVIATIPGGSFLATRLSPEIPGDFYDFQKLP